MPLYMDNKALHLSTSRGIILKIITDRNRGEDGILINNNRSAGIILPIFSLPTPYGIGSLGDAAFKFIDFLSNSGQRYWQVLPLGPTGFGDSPYQSFSAFAGNPYFIDPLILEGKGRIRAGEPEKYDFNDDHEYINYEKMFRNRFAMLKSAYRRSSCADSGEYADFCHENAFWLEDYSLYMALKSHFKQAEWLLWPKDIRYRRKDALLSYKLLLRDEIDFWKYVQYEFYSQWPALKAYANERGIRIIGDMPLYVSTDSADVWANGGIYLLDEDRRPAFVAGVPPDYFSEEGQLWGNCLYNWEAQASDGFLWWKKRIGFTAGLFDVVRIDHFIGIARYWAVPASSKSAKEGEYRTGPGKKLIEAIDEARGSTKIIAEDLGVLDEDVRALIRDSGYPGMRVTQFAFDGDPDNEHLPENHPQNCVAYTGTHDNETAKGFIKNAPAEVLENMKKSMGLDHKPAARDLISYTYSGKAGLAVIPMQDFLDLDNSARINRPSTLEGNWRWRLKPGDLSSELAEDIRKLLEAYGRAE